MTQGYPSRRALTLVVIATVMLAACAAGGAAGSTDVDLAQGSLDLPDGILFVEFVEHPQPAGNTVRHAHAAGFFYAVDGVQRLTVGNAAPRDLKPGEAAFAGANDVHAHTNPEARPSTWFFVGIVPASVRGGAPLFAGDKTVYATADLPPMPRGAYRMRLRGLTVAPQGGTAAQKYGGLESFVVLEGSLELRSADSPPKPMAAGDGATIFPGTAVRAVNKGAGAARILALFVTKDGETFSTDVSPAP